MEINHALIEVGFEKFCRHGYCRVPLDHAQAMANVVKDHDFSFETEDIKVLKMDYVRFINLEY